MATLAEEDAVREAVENAQEPAVKDALDREKAASDIEKSFIVEASAGTGKTTVLVQRVLALVRSGVPVHKLVAVTFTEKAAGELKARIRDALVLARSSSTDEERLLEQAVVDLDSASIGTIHSFCSDLLREFAIEAAIDPLFRVATEPVARELRKGAFERWFERVLAAPPPGVSRVLEGRRWNDDGPRRALETAFAELMDNRDMRGPWDSPDDNWRQAGDSFLATAHQLVEAVRGHIKVGTRDWAMAFLLDASRTLAEWAELSASGDVDVFDASVAQFEGRHRRVWGKAFSKRTLADTSARERAEEARGRFVEQAERFRSIGEEVTAARLQQELFAAEEEYARGKHEGGWLDFLDLLAKSVDLLRSRTDISAAIQERYPYILVDEVQDVDVLQAELFVRLTGAKSTSLWTEMAVSPGRLFLVGDPKQLIYRFRRADLSIYEALVAAVERGGGERLWLTTNFRSRPELQSFFDHTFARLFVEQTTVQARFVPSLASAHKNPETSPPLLALPIPEPYPVSADRNGDYKPCFESVEPSYSRTVARFVRDLLDDGYLIRDASTGAERAIRPSDICLLALRQRCAFSRDPALTDLQSVYASALDDAGVPHGIGLGDSFYAREDVFAFLQILRAVEWPTDTFSMYAALRSALLGFSDADLYQGRDAIAKRPATDGDRLDAVQKWLFELHDARNAQPFVVTAEEILRFTNARTRAAFAPGPLQGMRALSILVQKARAADAEQVLSFRAFVRALDAEAEAGRMDAVGEDSRDDGVSFLTVHRAKGLEFPVVILCDPTNESKRKKPSRFFELASRRLFFSPCGFTPRGLRENSELATAQDSAEQTRLLYVASTRARDLLVVPVFGDGKPKHWWVSPLYDSIYPPRDVGPLDFDGEPAGQPTVLHRPDDCGGNCLGSGLYAVPGRGFRVGWKDPRKRASNDTASDRYALLRGDEKIEGMSRQRFATWKTERGQVVQAASVSSNVCIATRQIAKGLSAEGMEVAVVYSDRVRTAVRGARFGTLLHELAAQLLLSHRERDVLDASTVQGLAAIEGRILGATDVEVEEAVVSVLHAWKSPLFERARSASRLHSECSVFERLVDGTVVAGVVDLAFLEEDPFGDARFTVVDFKTDLSRDSAVRDEYVVQVSLYARAIQAATGIACDAVLFGL